MIRIFITKTFDRWFRKTELTDEALRNAVFEMAAGLIDADLGAGVFFSALKKTNVPISLTRN